MGRWRGSNAANLAVGGIEPVLSARTGKGPSVDEPLSLGCWPFVCVYR
jgi:hypothetical protein